LPEDWQRFRIDTTVLKIITESIVLVMKLLVRIPKGTGTLLRERKKGECYLPGNGIIGPKI
jgi:hypothetical protein